MSIVIAIKEKNRIVMGCDSQVSYGYLKGKLDNNDCCKIWEIENCKNGLIGAVGQLRDCQIIQCEEHLIDELKQFRNEINYKYVVTQLTEKIYNILNSFRRVKKDSVGNLDEFIESALIFAYKNKAYLISNFLEVTPIDDYLVIGCGDQIAIGILKNNKSKTAEERIMEVIKSCADKSNGIDNNVVIKKT